MEIAILTVNIINLILDAVVIFMLYRVSQVLPENTSWLASLRDLLISLNKKSVEDQIAHGEPEKAVVQETKREVAPIEPITVPDKNVLLDKLKNYG